MDKWLLAWCNKSDILKVQFYLEEGWEPFSVCLEHGAGVAESVIYFRKCESVDQAPVWPARYEVGDPFP